MAFIVLCQGAAQFQKTANSRKPQGLMVYLSLSLPVDNLASEGDICTT